MHVAMSVLSSVAAMRASLVPRALPQVMSREQVVRSVAFSIIACPPAAVAYLFVVNPDALGSALPKLMLMVAGAFLAMMAGELSSAMAKWALARSDAE